MRTFLTIVFCKFYGRLKDDFHAMAALGVLLSVNVLTILGYYKVLFTRSSSILVPKAFEILVAVLVGLFLYFLFLKGKKYESIYEQFRQSKYSGKLGSRITILYIMVTILFLASLIPLARNNM